MRHWDQHGKSQNLYWGHREGDSDDLMFWATDKETLESFLLDDCHCTLKKVCAYHRERKATKRNLKDGSGYVFSGSR
jgi:hypothetical protein